MEPIVLVTGGSGFIGSYCILELLSKGYRVRTTIRSPERKHDVLEMLKAGKAVDANTVEFFVADLMNDEGWVEAVTGCTYVLHVASPLLRYEPPDENEIIIPATEGTLRVLKAARDAGVRRVVQTSSYSAVGYGHASNDKVFSEEHWSVVDGPGMRAYDKAKTLSEQLAWDFIKREGGSLELTAVNPAMTFGPVLGSDYTATILPVEMIVRGAYPACPQYEMGVVDVRDVADLHVRAMTSPKANGERFLCISGKSMQMIDMARALKKDLTEQQSSRVNTRVMPNWLFWIATWFDKIANLMWPEIGVRRTWYTEKATKVLGWQPRPPEEAIVATGKSLFDMGIIEAGK